MNNSTVAKLDLLARYPRVHLLCPSWEDVIEIVTSPERVYTQIGSDTMMLCYDSYQVCRKQIRVSVAAFSCRAPCHALFNDHIFQWQQNLTSRKWPSFYFMQKLLNFEAFEVK